MNLREIKNISVSNIIILFAVSKFKQSFSWNVPIQKSESVNLNALDGKTAFNFP